MSKDKEGEIDEDILQLTQYLAKFTKENKRKHENEIDSIIKETKLKLISLVEDEKKKKTERDEKIQNFKKNTQSYKNSIKEKNKTYKKSKEELSSIINDYKEKVKEKQNEINLFLQSYENEMKKIDEFQKQEWEELCKESIELLNKTKTTLNATKNESNEKLKAALAFMRY